MKTLTRICFAAFLALAGPRAAAAQEAAWVRVAPPGEAFYAQMPRRPLSRPARAQAGELKVAGRRYASAGEGGNSYLVWALKDPAGVGARLSAEGYVSERHGGAALYLDEAAEVAWGLLVEPELERLRENPPDGEEPAYPGMDYRREFEVGGRPAREYRAHLEKTGGPVYVCVDGARIYVVAALGPYSEAAELGRFVNSFALKAGAPPARRPGAAPGGGRPAALPAATTVNVDPALITREPDVRAGAPAPAPGHGGPLKATEVTKKAVLNTKPEPGFTEGARKFSVTGVVRLRAVLSKTGEVTNISVVKGLPHGLTSKAVAAARRVRFTPAQKDGRPVSQWVTFEYNFNIY